MKTYTYQYPKPSVTTDCIITKSSEDKKMVLLIKRKHNPFINNWALPGGFVEMDEDLLDGAKRELEEETGLKDIDLTQFKTFGKPNRDPRGRTISVIYYGFVGNKELIVEAGDDAAETRWFDLEKLPELAFDHKEIMDEFFEEKLN